MKLFSEERLQELFPNPLERATTSAIGIISWFMTYSEEIQPAHCQCKLCWTPKQYEEFIKNLVTTGEFGAIIVLVPRNEWAIYILDGHHRFEALRQFLLGELTIKTEEGQAIGWADFDKIAQRCFKGRVMGTLRELKTDEYDEALAEDIYARFNYASVAHS